MSRCTAIQRHNLQVKLVLCPDVLPAVQRQNLHIKPVFCPDVLPYRHVTVRSNLFSKPITVYCRQANQSLRTSPCSVSEMHFPRCSE